VRPNKIRVEPAQPEFFAKQNWLAGSTHQPESAGWNSELRVAFFAGFEYFPKKIMFFFDFDLFFLHILLFGVFPA